MGVSMMLFSKIGDHTKLLEKALDAAWLKNEAISNNIANVNTPGYKKSDVRFGDQLASAASEFQIGSLEKEKDFLPIGNDVRDIPAPEVIQDNFTSARQDGNNVDVESEMAQLAKNNIMYNALIQRIAGKFNSIRSAITGGSR
jgi:flagellar basal-body rod protein FlgB